MNTEHEGIGLPAAGDTAEGDSSGHSGGPPPPVGPPPPQPPPPAGRPGLPWEREGNRSPGSAFETIRLVLLQPSDAFGMMRRDGGLGDPLLFAVIFGTVGAFFGLLWQNTTRTLFGTMADADLAQIAALNSSGFVSFFLAPVFVLVFLALASIIIHVCLMLFGGAPHPLDVTLRVISYSAGATYLLAIIPLCGGILSGVWFLVATSIGIRDAHEVPGGRAVAAVLTPLVLVCCCCAAVFFLFSAAIMSMAGLAQ